MYILTGSLVWRTVYSGSALPCCSLGLTQLRIYSHKSECHFKDGGIVNTTKVKSTPENNDPELDIPDAGLVTTSNYILQLSVNKYIITRFVIGWYAYSNLSEKQLSRFRYDGNHFYNIFPKQ